jgi:hypothetical protein
MKVYICVYVLVCMRVGGCSGAPQQTPVPEPLPSIQVHIPEATQSAANTSINSSSETTLRDGSSFTAVPTGSASFYPACSLVSSALNSCISLIPSYQSLNLTGQVECLCYSSKVWNPPGFDDPVSNCAQFVSTAAPGEYLGLASLEGFCSLNDGLVQIQSSIYSSNATQSSNQTTTVSTSPIPTSSSGNCQSCGNNNGNGNDNNNNNNDNGNGNSGSENVETGVTGRFLRYRYSQDFT